MLPVATETVKEKGRIRAEYGDEEVFAADGRMPLSMKRTVRDLYALPLFLAAVLAIKILIVWELKDHPLLRPGAGLDTTAYVTLAQRVVAGDMALGPGLYFVSPLYIYFLSAALALFDTITAARVTQVALGTASVAAVFATAREWFGRRAAWLASLFAAGTGLFTFYETLILQAAIDPFLTSAVLATLALGLRTETRLRPAWWLIASGALFGIATLNRPNMLFGAVAVIATCFLLRRFQPGLLLLIGLVAGLAPVVVRNGVVAGEWTMVSSHGGLNLYIGNNPGATGFYHEVPGIRPSIEGQQEDTRRVAASALGREVSDAEVSSYFTARAITWIRENPLAATRLFIRKLFYTFHAQHVALPHSYPFFAYDTGSSLRFFVLGPWLLVPLGLAGLLMAPRTNFFIWAAFVPGYSIGVALFFVAERYRLPLLVPLCIGAGAALDGIWRSIASRRFSALTVPVVTIAAAAIAFNWPLPRLDDGRWAEGLKTAQQLVIDGDYAAADGWVERLEQSGAQPGRAHHGVGMQLVVRNQLDRALPHMKAAVDRGFLAPDDPEVWLRLGRLATRTSGPASAEMLFRRATQLAPGQAGARQQYGLNLVLLDRLEHARRELREAVRLDPRDPDSLSHLAYCEIKLGQVSEARTHVTAALQLDPGNALARQLSAALPPSR